MKNNLRKDVTHLTKVKFLNPAESNRGQFIKLLEQYASSIPVANSSSPYLSTGSTSQTLRKTRRIPENPRSSQSVFNDSLSFLDRSIRWQSDYALQNITPPVLFESLASGLLANLYNLNMIWDRVSAGGHEVERQVAKQLSDLVGWKNGSDGVFTYGGKGCHSYAVKMGLARCIPDVATNGLQSQKPVVITSKYNHYIIDNVCSLLNLGSTSCVKINTNNEEVMDLEEFEKVTDKIMSDNIPIACIILSGGSTINLNIDPVKKVRVIVEKLSLKHHLSYKPFIYFDSVVGWPWLFFKDYDFKNNPLNIAQSALTKIKKATKLIKEAVYADAMGVDFHKIGFAPYSCSAIVAKKAGDLHSMNSATTRLVEPQSFGNNFLQHHTLEHSRSAAPVFSAWSVLQGMGKNGFRTYIANLTEVADIFRDILAKNGFVLINPYSLCFGVVVVPIMPNGPRSYDELMTLTPEHMAKVSQYTYDLSNFLSDISQNKISQIEVGFLKTLVRPPQNKPFATIRIYPMSPFTDIKMAKKIAEEIIHCKQKFDKLNKLKHGNVPNVVHR